MEVKFYNRDARDVFLPPKSVDLFLIHPPYFKMTDDGQYGGDPNLQIHRLRDQEEFSNSMVTYLNNMSDALKDDGNILLIIPNCHDGILGIGDIIKNTNLSIDKMLIWHFGKVDPSIKNQYMANLILQIRKDNNFQYPVPGLASLIIEHPWVLTDVSKYHNLGFVYDGFPIEISDILIEAFSKEGDTVADIFGGTGTTVLSALQKNRKAIYNDASIDQFNLAKARVYGSIKDKDTPEVIDENKPIEFYSQDARKPFLKPNSVDLFITHPPFLNKLVTYYGGDSSLQVQNSDTVENFAKSMSEILHNMEIALKDSGAILLILPNTNASFYVIKDIIQKTNLIINHDIIWNFEKNDSKNEINHILYITKNKNTKHPVEKLSNIIINQNLTSFANFDSLPEKMIEELILVFSNPGDVVADPMGGTGTVAVISLKNDRRTIYNDVSPLQLHLAKKQVYDTIGYKEKDKNMTKDEVLRIMLESINNENRKLCKQNGMSDADIELNISQSQPSLAVILSGVYDNLKANNVIA